MKRIPALAALASAALIAALFSLGCSFNDAARRASGFPGESELNERQAELQEALPRSSLLIVPVYFADHDRWMPADAFGERLRRFAATTVVRAEPPEIGRRRSRPTSYLYLPGRMKQYRRWLERNDVGADYVIAAEVYTGRVKRGQLLVFDRQGRLVHSASVHWGGNPPAGMEDAADRLIERFLTDVRPSIH